MRPHVVVCLPPLVCPGLHNVCISEIHHVCAAPYCLTAPPRPLLLGARPLSHRLPLVLLKHVAVLSELCHVVLYGPSVLPELCYCTAMYCRTTVPQVAAAQGALPLSPSRSYCQTILCTAPTCTALLYCCTAQVAAAQGAGAGRVPAAHCTAGCAVQRGALVRSDRDREAAGGEGRRGGALQLRGPAGKLVLVGLHLGRSSGCDLWDCLILATSNCRHCCCICLNHGMS